MCPDEMIEDMLELQSRLDLDAPPTVEELECTLSKFKRWKAGGLSGILVLYGGALLWNRLLELIQEVWEEGKVVEDWKNAVVVPTPRTGDLKVCDNNWKGISLLDVVGKILARIVQERLQQIAEQILPESQSSFRKSGGCVDMIFVVR